LQTDRAGSRFESTQIQLVYVADSPRLRLVWEWQARAGHGPIEHTISIQNLSKEPVWLPLQPSFRFDWEIEPPSALERFWVEKGADVPSSEGTHLDAMHDGDTWLGTSSTYARPAPGQPREMIPYLLVDAPGDYGQGWYVGVEFSGLIRITLERNGDSLRGEAGLNPRGALPDPLPSGGTYAAPTIFLGAFTGGPEAPAISFGAGMRRALTIARCARTVVPLMVYNGWGGSAWRWKRRWRMVMGSRAARTGDVSSGCRLVRGVGDWRADPKDFPHGIAGSPTSPARHGLRFGLWVDWTRASSHEPGALNVDDPPRVTG
jgi:hypothetical protein